ncbi:C-type lectin domain family 4 member E-like isoform X2 [Astatotilapia calliptera]|uniref:C-type lectin domain family 4 member E-like isoform X2 n=1 Tax=Astatotilapia calliptera TaxID=8154 RepID=UPI000E3F94CB|nr:C-type lectin domain family 4 member E-like isoform X2 [Astatotilapia calliptera]
MPEAEVVYSDVKLARGKKRANEAVTTSTDSTYSEIKISKTQPSTAELSEDPQQAVVRKGSKVTSERVVLVVLGVLLAAALIALCFTTFEIIKTNKKVKYLEDDKMKCDNNLTETLSKIKPCSTVQPTCPAPKVMDDPCYKCEEGWEQHGGKCYYFSISKSSWEQSRDECRAKRGDLVKIDSREEQKLLERRLRDVMTEDEDKFWIGLTDSAVEGRWVWVDRSPLDQSLTFWSKGEPDNWNGTHEEHHPDGEDCVRMGDQGGADDLKCWFDAFCSTPHRSICEKAEVKGQFKKVCD